MIVVSDASPLIALERIQCQELLRNLFGRIFIPPAVRREVFGTKPLPDWITEKQPTLPSHPSKDLGEGEMEAIALALELNADWLLIDDLDGRKEALRSGLMVMGTIGVLARAKREGVIAELKPLLDKLEAAGFYFGQNLRFLALQMVGEFP